ncbi:MAG: FAD-dependent oxidoreductase [Alphaproteobacteria bacterium]
MSQGEGLRVLVVGAGPAGSRAAQTLARHGVRPVVVDEAPRNGGQIYRQQPDGFTRPARALYGFEARKATRLHDDFAALAGLIDHRPETLVWSLWQGVAYTAGPDGPAELAYDALLLATGAMDRAMPLPGWTLPGVYGMGGAQVALKYQACAIGRRVVFCGTGPLLYLVAYQYKHAGAEVVAVLDTARLSAGLGLAGGLAAGGGTILKGVYYANWLRRHGVPILNGVTPLGFDGTRQVEAVRIRDGKGALQSFACDAAGYGFGIRPETQLADLAGASFRYDGAARLWLPEVDEDGRASKPGLYLAGDGVSIMGADAAELRGELAALALLKDHGIAVSGSRIASLRRRLKRLNRFRGALDALFPVPAHIVPALDDAVIVCRCEAIRAGEIRHAARNLDAGEINRCKALTRAGMGRCQARLCAPNIAELLASELKVPIEAVGRLRGQAPVKPVPIGAIGHS